MLAADRVAGNRRLHCLRAAVAVYRRGHLRRLPCQATASGADAISCRLRRHHACYCHSIETRPEGGACAHHGALHGPANRLARGRHVTHPCSAPPKPLVAARFQPVGDRCPGIVPPAQRADVGRCLEAGEIYPTSQGLEHASAATDGVRRISGEPEGEAPGQGRHPC